METVHKMPVLDKVVNALRDAAVEIEELQVTMSLGKAEARDKYEELKKKFDLFIHDSKAKIASGKEMVEEINMKFDELRVQLALGKADTLDSFREQKKKVLLALHDLEVKIKTNEKLKRYYDIVLIEIEKFKVQLELLEKKYESGKEGAKEAFEKGKEQFNLFVEKIKSRFSEEKEETKWEHFQNEVSEAFSHLKKAFAST